MTGAEKFADICGCICACCNCPRGITGAEKVEDIMCEAGLHCAAGKSGPGEPEIGGRGETAFDDAHRAKPWWGFGIIWRRTNESAPLGEDVVATQWSI